jgi:hypothetical protein
LCFNWRCGAEKLQVKQTALIGAAAKNFTDCARLLVNVGANMDFQDHVRDVAVLILQMIQFSCPQHNLLFSGMRVQTFSHAN